MHTTSGRLLAALIALAASAGCARIPSAAAAAVSPANLQRAGAVDERFQSFNVEMIEVTGGRFWKPYNSAPEQPRPKPAPTSPAELDANLYQQRPPTDLANPRLRKLAAALGPAYVRVSGTWANTTYFHDSGAPAPATPPAGFNGVLTRPQWKGVVEFAKAANARIVTSFAISPGVRDAQGVWTPREASKLLAYTKSLGGEIAAAEFMNEPNATSFSGAPKGYTAADYGRDVKIFRTWLKQASPHTILAGPGSVGEGTPLAGGDTAKSAIPFLPSADLLAAAGPVFDAFSYHFYGAVSQRCAAMVRNGTTADAALSPEWLARTEKAEEFYRGLRDRIEPGRPLWVTETADAACGGNPWGSTFLDSFRYLDQLGRLSHRGVQVVMHNTLAASDYGLLDETSFAPRPNYWAALLWRRFMGSTVLDATPLAAPGLDVYAHCLRGRPGGVALLAINTDRQAGHVLELGMPSLRLVLTATSLEDRRVLLNGRALELGAADELPGLDAIAAPPPFRVALDPASITFVTLPDARNAACR